MAPWKKKPEHTSGEAHRKVGGMGTAAAAVCRESGTVAHRERSLRRG